jgi:hypothetical protein
MGEHIRPALSYLNKHRRPSDKIYIHYASLPAFEYYAPDFGVNEGDYIKGRSSEKEPGKYWNDFVRARNRGKVWFVFSHDCRSCREDEADLVRNFEGLGSSVVVDRFDGVTVYSYDSGVGS